MLADYLELTKPRLTALAVLTTWVGMAVGAREGMAWPHVGWTLLGAWLVGGGGHALNEWLERDRDALMERTKRRPLPAGRLRPVEALIFGALLSASGVLMLWRWAHPLAGWLGWVTVVSYVAIYTPLKRMTSLCTLVGAVPGAMPPLIGWAAARGELSLEAWVLFAILFVWQLPHFLALAWVYRADYARANFRMLSTHDPDGSATSRQMVLYGLALLPISLLPTLLGMAGSLYFVGAVIVGVWFVVMTLAMARARGAHPAGRVFAASLGYLPTVLLLMVLAPAVQGALPSYGSAPAFTLTNQDRRPVSETSLHGQVWVADFIFTRCAGQCPRMNAQMVQLAQQMPALRLVSFTVDPAWDTPEVLAAYANGYPGASSPSFAEGFGAASRWQFVTGEPETMRRLCLDGFKLSVAEDAGNPQEPLTHSTRLVLVDQVGTIRGFYDANDAEAVRRLQRDARILLRRSS